MATASVSITPECSICCESFKTPKVLTCCHTFCLCCIEKYIEDKGVKFPCPICKQCIMIPAGGARMFITNFIVETSKTTTKPTCVNHNLRGVNYYCNNCKEGLCFKCVIKQHKDHETLDVESKESRNIAIEKLQPSLNFIQSRITNLEKTRSELLQSFDQLKSLCEDSCATMTEKTEKIISDLRECCEQTIENIRNNLEENRTKVEKGESKITSEINMLRDIKSNISPLTKTTFDIFMTLPCLIEIENLGESRKDNLCLQYLQWEGNNFNLDIDQFESVILKPFYIPGSYQFLFDISDIEESGLPDYYNSNKFRHNNLEWSCRVSRSHAGQLFAGMSLSHTDNPKLNYCIIDGQISLCNIDDGNKTKTITVSNLRLEVGSWWSYWCPITWSELIDKDNGYLSVSGKCVVQCDISNIKEISWK